MYVCMCVYRYMYIMYIYITHTHTHTHTHARTSALTCEIFCPVDTVACRGVAMQNTFYREHLLYRTHSMLTPLPVAE